MTTETTYILTSDVDGDAFRGDVSACFAQAAKWIGDECTPVQASESGFWGQDGVFHGGPEACGFTIAPEKD